MTTLIDAAALKRLIRPTEILRLPSTELVDLFTDYDQSFT
jgi:hypothetical protein